MSKPFPKSHALRLQIAICVGVRKIPSTRRRFAAYKRVHETNRTEPNRVSSASIAGSARVMRLANAATSVLLRRIGFGQSDGRLWMLCVG
jgi:hypothetical protein|tara:strand:+ start:647 stop:916 length:270 start_codon:yes stop_codon:yes gene_type:complete